MPADFCVKTFGWELNAWFNGTFNAWGCKNTHLLKSKSIVPLGFPNAPWEWNIYLQIWHKIVVNLELGKFSSPIWHIGIIMEIPLPRKTDPNGIDGPLSRLGSTTFSTMCNSIMHVIPMSFLGLQFCWWKKSQALRNLSFSELLGFRWNILLIEENLHHLACIKPRK